jgi:hypothetical protein
MCTSWDVHKTIQHVGPFNGHELWLTSLKQLSQVERKNMTISKVEIDHLSVTSSKSFEAVLAALKAAIGRPDMVEFANAIRNAQTFAELERTVDQSLGNTGLMMFMELDQGGILRKDRARQAKDCSVCNRESTHHERNGQARSRRRILRAGHNLG